MEAALIIGWFVIIFVAMIIDFIIFQSYVIPRLYASGQMVGSDLYITPFAKYRHLDKYKSMLSDTERRHVVNRLALNLPWLIYVMLLIWFVILFMAN